MRFRAVLAVALLGACGQGEPRGVSPTDADYVALFLAQQRLQQQLFLRQMDSIRIKQCLPNGFAFDCH